MYSYAILSSYSRILRVQIMEKFWIKNEPRERKRARACYENENESKIIWNFVGRFFVRKFLNSIFYPDFLIFFSG